MIARALRHTAEEFARKVPFLYHRTPLDEFYERMFFVGIVTDNRDPGNAGRVKVRLPEFDINDEDKCKETWAKPAYTIFRWTGTFIVPNKGDVVFCFFRNKRPDECYYLTSIYTPYDKPTSVKQDKPAPGIFGEYYQDDVHVIYHSKNGNFLRLVDANQNRWTIYSTPGVVIEVDGQEKAIRLKTEKASISLEPKTIRISANEILFSGICRGCDWKEGGGGGTSTADWHDFWGGKAASYYTPNMLQTDE